MSIQINSFLVGLLVGVSLCSLFLIYQNNTKIEEVTAILKTSEFVICTK